jgi:hypothetical protein
VACAAGWRNCTRATELGVKHNLTLAALSPGSATHWEVRADSSRGCGGASCDRVPHIRPHVAPLGLLQRCVGRLRRCGEQVTMALPSMTYDTLSLHLVLDEENALPAAFKAAGTRWMVLPRTVIRLMRITGRQRWPLRGKLPVLSRRTCSPPIRGTIVLGGWGRAWRNGLYALALVSTTRCLLAHSAHTHAGAVQAVLAVQAAAG